MTEGLDQGGDVVGVAGDDLHEAVLAGHQRLVVDAARVGLAEAELAALGEEAGGALEAVVDLALVLVAGRRAVDDYARPRQGLTGLEAHLVTQILEGALGVRVYRQLRPAAHQMLDSRPVRDQRRALVEGDLVDPQIVLEVGEQADQRLADRAGSHDVDDATHLQAPV